MITGRVKQRCTYISDFMFQELAGTHEKLPKSFALDILSNESISQQNLRICIHMHIRLRTHASTFWLVNMEDRWENE
jgi:hypothetical protein